MRRSLRRFVPQRFQRRVQELVHEPVEGLANLRLCFGVERRELVQQPGSSSAFTSSARALSRLMVGAVAR